MDKTEDKETLCSTIFSRAIQFLLWATFSPKAVLAAKLLAVEKAACGRMPKNSTAKQKMALLVTSLNCL